MGKREIALRQLLLGGTAETRSLPFPGREEIMRLPLKDELQRVYLRLGGIQTEFPLHQKKGSWDIEWNGVAVELDEKLHFNRYRAVTLTSSLYKDLSNFPLEEYQAYCTQFEQQCLKAGGYGGKWSNPSCERQFGTASPSGVLSGNGSPRWKQRAFYDFVKDLSPIVLGVPLARVAVWDDVTVGSKTYTLGTMLDKGIGEAAAAVSELVKSRIVRSRFPRN
jgi:hypothetical protein